MRTDSKTLAAALRSIASDLNTAEGLYEGALLEAAERLEEQAWISVEDRLPDNRVNVIACKVSKDGLFYLRCAYIDVFLGKTKWCAEDGEYIQSATDWMPMPKPPKGKS